MEIKLINFGVFLAPVVLMTFFFPCSQKHAYIINYFKVKKIKFHFFTYVKHYNMCTIRFHFERLYSVVLSSVPLLGLIVFRISVVSRHSVKSHMIFGSSVVHLTKS